MTKPNTIPDQRTLNLIGEETTIEGEIKTNGDIRIDGIVRGDITAKGKIVIGKSGNIVGNTNANGIDIAGHLKGNIVTKALYIKETSNIISDIVTEQIVIEPGAIFIGKCDMPNNEKFSENK